MSEETVRYERLRPAQIVARREACPVAYLPIGTIEW
ncbi:MAG: creatininase family protein, partial [Chloroflexi bacterium]|nr:creatininase family protein [Chloroflexota bacterium]